MDTFFDGEMETLRINIFDYIEKQQGHISAQQLVVVLQSVINEVKDSLQINLLRHALVEFEKDKQKPLPSKDEVNDGSKI